jgi:hypothetical protein
VAKAVKSNEQKRTMERAIFIALLSIKCAAAFSHHRSALGAVERSAPVLDFWGDKKTEEEPLNPEPEKTPNFWMAGRPERYVPGATKDSPKKSRRGITAQRSGQPKPRQGRPGFVETSDPSEVPPFFGCVNKMHHVPLT